MRSLSLTSKLISWPAAASVAEDLKHHADAEDEEGAVDPQERAAVEAAVAARTGTRERPPPWLDVTTALQFMTEDSRLVFHSVSVQLRTSNKCMPENLSPHTALPCTPQ